MSAELVHLATSEDLNEPDWSKNIEICEVVNHDPVESKVVIKAIKKRLSCKDPNSQVFSVVLLEMLMNNCGEHVHRMVVETGLLQLMVKIVKKKLDSPVREKLFLLLDATQTALGGASGKFPQYYKAYYELVRARVQFQDHSAATSNPSDSNAEAESLPAVTTFPQISEVDDEPPNPQSVPDSSIIEKATTVMEVLRQVLDAVDPLHPEGAANEFTLDLVEQCSFQKEQVMHLVMTSCDDKLVSQAIELNEQLQKLLIKHDQLLNHDDQLVSGSNSSRNAVNHDDQLVSGSNPSKNAVNHDNQLVSAPKSSSTAVNHGNQLLSAPNPSSIAVNHEETEDEEEADCLLPRDRKGKACAQAWKEDPSESSSNSSDSFILENLPPPPPPPFWSSLIETQEPEAMPPTPGIPPPPAKQKERELFFKEKQTAFPGKVGEKLSRLSLRRRNASGSQSGSTKLSE